MTGPDGTLTGPTSNKLDAPHCWLSLSKLVSLMLKFGVWIGLGEVGVFWSFTLLQWVSWQVCFIKEVRGQKEKYISNYVMD